jgi:hypothetical protein
MRNRKNYWNIFLVACVLVGSAFGIFLYHNDHKTYTKHQIDMMFKPITSKYGISIVYEVGDGFFSDLVNPILPAGPDRRSKVTPIRHRLLVRYPLILQKAFKKYPVNVINKYLKAIYFAEEIDENGFKYGGSYDPFRRIVYLTNNGRQTDDLAESSFHHEFSSLLLKRHSFFLNPWEEFNPEGFKYLYEIYGNFKSMPSSISIRGKGSKQDYYEGFVNDYGRTDFENDFNEYSAMIFTYPEKFKKIMNQYPRVRGKFLVWLDFYHKIDPIFTEAYLLGKD